MKLRKLAVRLLSMIATFCFACVGCSEPTSPTKESVTPSPAPTPQGGISDTTEPYRAIAYVTVPASKNWRWIGRDDGDTVVSDVDTRYVTHINFAFGMIDAYQFEPDKQGCPLKSGQVASKEAYKASDGEYHYKATVNGWIEEMGTVVNGDKYLKALVALKEKKPSLKVLLSIGGWNSDGFCYMAQTEQGRAQFIQSCIDLINEYALDGIDLDWEYPTNGGWDEIASCPDCTKHAKILLTEFRHALTRQFGDSPKLLTIASGCGQPWADEEAMESLDYMNVMCYDYNPGSGGDNAGLDSAKGFMEDHSAMVGNTAQNRKKINLGVPFYNEGGPHLVPYHDEWSGHVDASPELTKDKMEWVKNSGYGGAFYWAYSMDIFEQDVSDPSDKTAKILQRTVYETLNK